MTSWQIALIGIVITIAEELNGKQLLHDERYEAFEN